MDGWMDGKGAEQWWPAKCKNCAAVANLDNAANGMFIQYMGYGPTFYVCNVIVSLDLIANNYLPQIQIFTLT